jgi:xanthine dehydrogenase YagR molybdenum-binding subunit
MFLPSPGSSRVACWEGAVARDPNWVNADVPSIEAILVEEHDPHVNALGIRGVGEIGITGTADAVANAVWHATGVRVRRFRSGRSG